GEIPIQIQADELVCRDVLQIHRSVITFGTLKSLIVRPASELPVRAATRSSRMACLTLVTTCGVGSIPLTSNLSSCSTYSTMRLSCSASSLFSSSATWSMASFATYSTSASLIFMSKRNLRDQRCAPWLVHPRRKLGPNPAELL